MPQTTHLALPLIDAAQAQKHVTHNEALAMIDALAHLSVAARNVSAPSASPVEGDRVLVGAGATGAFAGKSGQVATFLAGAWTFLPPQPGWRAFVEAETLLLLYDGAAWVDFGAAIRALQNLSRLGVGTIADAANPLSARLNAALFTAAYAGEGGDGDLRVKLNKESAAKTVSQLYQSNYSGRAETGLAGDDNFRVKVSANGAVWRDGIVVDRTTGAVTFPSGGPTRVLTFAGSGVYTPSPGMRFAEVVLFGAGGGGGSGARQAPNAAASGGGGGAGGGVARGLFSAAQVGASQTISIGAGGLGGAAQAASTSAGNPGGAGGNTAFGALLTGFGGGGGSGGGLAAASAGGGPGSAFSAGSSASGASQGFGFAALAAGGFGGFPGHVTLNSYGGGGAGAPATGGPGAGAGVAVDGATGGGAGGGITAANAPSAGGQGGWAVYNSIIIAGAAGAVGAPGGGGTPPVNGPLNRASNGGGGGGASLTAPGSGGAGGNPGGGGGGGGASQNGASSGAGGAGGAGFAVIIEHF
ncbi:MAG: hypothetical protein CTY15_07210 [Methylocystis sp.]|nr:MAG: hypothetical protein CTY15_07210 [Methylocystis sp.]